MILFFRFTHTTIADYSVHCEIFEDEHFGFKSVIKTLENFIFEILLLYYTRTTRMTIY